MLNSIINFFIKPKLSNNYSLYSPITYSIAIIHPAYRSIRFNMSYSSPSSATSTWQDKLQGG